MSSITPDYRYLGALNNFVGTTVPVATNDSTQGYSPGSLWYNQTTAEIWRCTSAAASAAVWIYQSSSADFYGYTAGRVYLPYGSSTSISNTITTLNGTIRFVPFIIKQRMTLASLSVNISTAATGNFQLALYASDPVGKKPLGSALVSSASVSTGTAGYTPATVTFQISPGLYWAGLNCDNTATSVRAGGTALVNMAQLIGSTTGVNITSATTLQYYTIASAFGTWPALTTASTFGEVLTAPPVVAFAVASVP